MTTQNPAQDVSDAAIAQFVREFASGYRFQSYAMKEAAEHIMARARELQQAQVVGTKPSAAWQQAYKEIAATPLSEIKGDLYQAVKKRSEEIEAATPQSSAPVVGDALLKRAYEVVHHEPDCPSIGGNGDKDCKCDAAPFLRDLESALTGRG